MAAEAAVAITVAAEVAEAALKVPDPHIEAAVAAAVRRTPSRALATSLSTKAGRATPVTDRSF